MTGRDGQGSGREEKWTDSRVKGQNLMNMVGLGVSEGKWKGGLKSSQSGDISRSGATVRHVKY